MQFMLILKADKNSESGVMPSQETIVAMTNFHQDMVKAGVLLAAEGLYPSSYGARVEESRGKTTVVDGPFTEAKELVGGFWMIEVKSLAEATEWAKRLFAVPNGKLPTTDGYRRIEIRKVINAADFAPAE